MKRRHTLSLKFKQIAPHSFFQNVKEPDIIDSGNSFTSTYRAPVLFQIHQGLGTVVSNTNVDIALPPGAHSSEVAVLPRPLSMSHSERRVGAVS